MTNRTSHLHQNPHHITTIIENIRPYTTSGIVTIIPSNTSTYNQYFSLPTVLDKRDYNYISRIIVRIDTSGIYNVPVAETFQKNGVPTTVQPGYYSSVGSDPNNLQNLTATTLSTTGANANKFITTQPLQFSAGSSLIYVLGFESFGTSVIPAGTIAGDTLNVTGDLDTLVLSASLIQAGTSLGSNPITIVTLDIQSPGAAVTYSETSQIALSTLNFNTIQWSLNTAFGKPYIIQTPIVIFTQISSQKRVE